MTDHVSSRLYCRVREAHMAIARRMVELASGDNVALVSPVGCHTVSSAYRATGDTSNGDNLVVIVRGNTPVTIMYCRSRQVNVTHLRVTEIVNI
jgi:hypothetical protein